MLGAKLKSKNRKLKSKNRKIKSEIQESVRRDEHNLIIIPELEAVV